MIGGFKLLVISKPPDRGVRAEPQTLHPSQPPNRPCDRQKPLVEGGGGAIKRAATLHLHLHWMMTFMYMTLDNDFHSMNRLITLASAML